MLNDHCHRVSTHLQSINIIIIFGFHLPLYLSSIRDVLMETFTVLVRDGSHISGEKNPSGIARKWSVNDMLHPKAQFEETSSSTQHVSDIIMPIIRSSRLYR